MKGKIKLLYFLIFIAVSSVSYGQMAAYNYKQELKGVSEQWHKIILPTEIFRKTKQDLIDIRVFGIKANKDTIEAPYLLRLTTEKITRKNVSFKTLNVTNNENGYYFTFEIPTEEPINQINLDFKQENFDWRVKLEGSQNQNEWFTVLENYRILSIKNEETNFQFTKLTFENSKYRFFRLRIGNKEKPELNSATIAMLKTTEGIYRKYKVKKVSTKENKKTKQTEIDVELELPVRISKINIDISETFDYYRPITIKYVTDSLKTEQGWVYNYSTLTSGILNSIEKNEFQLKSTTAQKLKIFIDNHDNQPLTVNAIQAKGYIHELKTRFTDQQVTYYLTYGNNKASKPNYDIERFSDKIPKKLSTLNLSTELSIQKKQTSVTEPLFKQKIWLWAIMLVIILLLGWFSIKMIKNK